MGDRTTCTFSHYLLDIPSFLGLVSDIRQCRPSSVIIVVYVVAVYVDVAVIVDVCRVIIVVAGRAQPKPAVITISLD